MECTYCSGTVLEQFWNSFSLLHMRAIMHISIFITIVSNHVTMRRITCCVLALSFKVGPARTVLNTPVTMFCRIPLMFAKSGLFQTENGAAC